VLPLLHIGEEGRRIFDMRAVVDAVRHSPLIEQALESRPGAAG